MDVDLVVFDLDGTLADTKRDLAQAVNATRADLGLPALEHSLLYSYVGNGAPVLIRRALGERMVSHRDPLFSFAFYHGASRERTPDPRLGA